MVLPMVGVDMGRRQGILDLTHAERSGSGMQRSLRASAQEQLGQGAREQQRTPNSSQVLRAHSQVEPVVGLWGGPWLVGSLH